MVFLPTSGNSAARNPYAGDFDYAQRIMFSPGAVSEHQGSGPGPALIGHRMVTWPGLPRGGSNGLESRW